MKVLVHYKARKYHLPEKRKATCKVRFELI